MYCIARAVYFIHGLPVFSTLGWSCCRGVDVADKRRFQEHEAIAAQYRQRHRGIWPPAVVSEPPAVRALLFRCSRTAYRATLCPRVATVVQEDARTIGAQRLGC